MLNRIRTCLSYQLATSVASSSVVKSVIKQQTRYNNVNPAVIFTKEYLKMPNRQIISRQIHVNSVQTSKQDILTAKEFKSMLINKVVFKKPVLINEHLNFNACNKLTQLPDNITVNGDVFIKECHNFTKTPYNFKAGSLIIEKCNGFDTLTSVNVDEVIINSCPVLRKIEDNPQIERITFDNCNYNFILATDFQKASCFFIDCDELYTIPDEFKVKNLYIYNCQNFIWLPKKPLNISDNLIVKQCKNFKLVPIWVLEEGHKKASKALNVNLEYNGFSEDVVAKLIAHNRVNNLRVIAKDEIEINSSLKNTLNIPARNFPVKEYIVQKILQLNTTDITNLYETALENYTNAKMLEEIAKKILAFEEINNYVENYATKSKKLDIDKITIFFQLNLAPKFNISLTAFTNEFACYTNNIYAVNLEEAYNKINAKLTTDRLSSFCKKWLPWQLHIHLAGGNIHF